MIRLNDTLVDLRKQSERTHGERIQALEITVQILKDRLAKIESRGLDE